MFAPDYEHILRLAVLFLSTITIGVLMWRPGYRQMHPVEAAYLFTFAGMIAAGVLVNLINDLFSRRD